MDDDDPRKHWCGGFYDPQTPEEAERTIDFATGYCRACPMRTRCFGEECAVYRADQQAVALLATPVIAGVPMREDITR
jgi:hypothetical protein